MTPEEYAEKQTELLDNQFFEYDKRLEYAAEYSEKQGYNSEVVVALSYNRYLKNYPNMVKLGRKLVKELASERCRIERVIADSYEESIKWKTTAFDLDREGTSS